MPVVLALETKQVSSSVSDEPALRGHQQNCGDEAEGRALGRGGDACIERAHDDAEHHQRLDQIAQQPDALGQRHLDRSATRSRAQARKHDPGHE